MAVPGERGLLFGGTQRGAAHKISTSAMVPQSLGNPCPLRQTPPFPSLVFWLLSSLALSLLVSWVLLFGCSYHRVHSNTWKYRVGKNALIIECTLTRTLLRLGNGCSYHRVRSNTNVIMVWAWMHRWFGHGCSGNRMLLEKKEDSGCF